MQISTNKVVTLNYTLKNDAGEILDQSQNSDFVYLHGHDQIIPGLEAALLDHTTGDELSVHIEPKEGYGEHNPQLTQQVPKNMFPGDAEIKVGTQFHAEGPDGQPIAITIAEVNDDEVVIDGNHPMAGIALNFEVTVMEVRDASTEEQEHGHAHGPDGHHHH